MIVAAMGWFISWARELANSPSMITRFMCASSASNWRSLSRSFSARLRSVTSTWVPDYFNHLSVRAENRMADRLDVSHGSVR